MLSSDWLPMKGVIFFYQFLVFSAFPPLPGYFIQIYPVSEGYLRKIPVERRGTFDCPRNRYFSQITLTNRIYLFNSAEYLTASKTVACKQVQNFSPPRSFDFQSTKTGKIFSKK